MEKIIRKYGVVILLYIVIVCSIILVNERLKMLNESNISISQTR